MLESVTGEEVEAVGRDRWVREVGNELPGNEVTMPADRAIGVWDRAFSAMFRLPFWLAASLAVAAFALAAAAIFALEVTPARFGSTLAILGTVLLLLFLLAGGAIYAKVRTPPGPPPGRSK